MAVCLRLAAGGSVAGVGESALRALSKLDQVMPSRLRSQVSAVHDATVTLTSELVRFARRTRRADDAGAGLPRPRARAASATSTARATPPSGGWSRTSWSRRAGAGICWPTTATARTGAACGWTGCPTCGRVGSTFVAAGGARRGGLRAALDQRVAVPVRRAGPLSGARSMLWRSIFRRHRSTIEADGPDACIVTAGADDPERMVFYLATAGVRVRGARTARGGRRRRVGGRAAAARGEQAVTFALGRVPAQAQAEQQQPAMRLETHRQRVPPGCARSSVSSSH